jgi:hypothetical protein
MDKTDKIAAFFLGLLVVCFAGGLWVLFALRFESGDVYPQYSSLRSDPLGVKVFFQALEQMPALSVERHFRSLSKLPVREKLTLLYLGLRPDFLKARSQPDLDRLEAMAKDGARLVFAFRSGLKRPFAGIVAASPPKDNSSPKEDSQKPETEQPKEDAPGKNEGKRPAGERWEVKADYLSSPGQGQQNKLVASLKDQLEGLPPAFPLHTAFCFKDLGQAWRVIYSAGDCPVIIERPLGAGSIILVADSYIFSNEAMLKERSPGLLSWLAGNCRLVVFDEFHLGVQESPGIMTLLRKYRLHGFFAGLMLLAGLFAWQNLVRFIPEGTTGETREPLALPETDQMDGLISLLRRNIKSGSLLKTCFEEWEKSIGRDCRGMEEKIKQAQGIVQDENGKALKGDAAAAYREISRILSDGTRR